MAEIAILDWNNGDKGRPVCDGLPMPGHKVTVINPETGRKKITKKKADKQIVKDGRIMADCCNDCLDYFLSLYKK